MTSSSPIRAAAIGILASFSLLLSGCFITPGKFTSELQIADDNTFTFTYEGEIFFLGLSKLAQESAKAEVFEASICYDEETYEERECNEAELAEQRKEWDANASYRASKAKQEAEQMAAIMGGIDPSDPEAVADLVALLKRQKGWNKVEDKGDGVFDISYSASGMLSHDFMFPIIEGFANTGPFVQVFLREGDVVRVNAPGFAAQNEENPMTGMLGMMGGMGSMAALASLGAEGSDPGEELPNFPAPEGTFRIITAGGAAILANNTDEGPTTSDMGQVLTWDVSARSKSAPTALISLSD